MKNKKNKNNIECTLFIDEEKTTASIEFKNNYDMYRYLGALESIGMITLNK